MAMKTIHKMVLWLGLAGIGMFSLPASGQQPGAAPPVLDKESFSSAVARGTVVDAEGPVVGATVLVAVTDIAGRREILTTRTRTDARGRFEVDLSSIGQGQIGIQVNAFSPRHSEAMKIEILHTSELPVEISIELKPGLTVSGRVFDLSGKPIAGATVEIPYVRPATTEFDGFFSIVGAPMSRRFEVIASAPGFAPLSRQATLKQDRTVDALEFRLYPQRTVLGKVVDTRGNPIEGAEVTLYLPLQRTRTQTDERGEFHLTDLPYEASKAEIVATHSEFAQHEQKTVIGEGNTSFTLVMSRGGLLNATVLDTQQRPVRHARVTLNTRDGQWGQTVGYSDAAGRFRLPFLPPDKELAMRVFPPGQEELRRRGELVAEQTGSTVRGDVNPWPDGTASDFNGLLRGNTIRLMRRDREEDSRPAPAPASASAPAPAPAPDAPIAAEYTGTLESGGLRMGGTFVGADGRRGTWRAERKADRAQSLGGIWQWEEILDAPQDKTAPAQVIFKIADDATTQVQVLLPAGWDLAGRAVNPAGEPVEKARISVARWNEIPWYDLFTTSDADGKFRLENLPPAATLFVVARKADVGGVSQNFAGPIAGGDAVAGGGLVELRLTAGGGGGCGSPPEPGESPFEQGPKAGEKAPEFTAKTLDGKTISLADLKGKWVLLDFWSSWCGPCIYEIPHLREVYERHGKRDDFVMLGVSLDDEEADLREAMKEHKVTWPQLFDGKGWDNAVGAQFKVFGIPQIYLIGPDGMIRETNLRGEAIKEAVERALSPGQRR